MKVIFHDTDKEPQLEEHTAIQVEENWQGYTPQADLPTKNKQTKTKNRKKHFRSSLIYPTYRLVITAS